MTRSTAERRALHRTLTNPPKAGEAPDLGRLRTLLADHRQPWWLDLPPDGDETGHDGTYTVGGILAHSTTAEIESGADEIHEIGGLFPTEAEALAVAAVNAAPWLLDRVDQAGDVLRQLIARHRPEPARSDPTVELCAGCGKVWPCPDAVIIGTDQATPEDIAAAMAGLGPRPAPPAAADTADECADSFGGA